MSLSFKFIPLTFLNDENEIKKQIRNTIILKYFFERNSEIVHLEDLITGTQYGYNASALVHGRNKFLRISDITDGKVNWETVPYCNCTDEETYLLFPNDILIARTGGTTGKSFLISEPPALSIYAGYLIRIRANEDTNPDYLNLFLNSYVYWSQIVSLNEDNFRPSVNANKLKKLILPKCDTKAQNDAVQISNGEFISGYDDLYFLIDDALLKYVKAKDIHFENKRQLELNKHLKKCILNEAISGQLTQKWRGENPNIKSAENFLEEIRIETNILKEKKLKRIEKNEKPFELPKSWGWCKLGEIGEAIIGVTYKPEQVGSKGIPILRSNNIFDSKIDYNNLIKVDIAIPEKKITKKDDILICVRNGSRDLIGKSALIDKEGMSFGAFMTVFRSSFNSYLHVFFQSNIFKDQINDEKSTGINQLTQGVLNNILLPLPPYEEQIKIVESVNHLMQKCSDLEKEISESEKNSMIVMQTILKEAFIICNKTETLDSLFDDVNYNLYVAMIHKQIENRLRINYGEVATQKTVFNINAFTDQKIPYNFINSNHGTFSPQLKDDLGKNIYLIKDKKGNGEVFIVNPSKEKEVLDALSNPKNKQFVRAVNEVLDIYELPFINKETDKIELLNTVAKLIIDCKTSDLDKIYKGMQDWEIKQVGFKTKAEKFSKMDTAKMIELIKNLNLIDKLF